MECAAIDIVSEFHGIVQIVRTEDAKFTGHSGKGNAVASTQFKSVFGLGTIEHIRVTGRIGTRDSDVVRGNPGSIDTEFNNKAFLLGRHPAAIEAETSAPVTFVDGAVVRFAHIEAMILHRGSKTSTELLLREESAHAQSKGKVLEVVLVVLDVEHTPSARSRKTDGEARSLGGSFGFSLLLGFFGGDGIGNSLLTGGLFGSGDRIGASLFGSDRIGDGLLASLFGGDRVGDGLLTGGFHSGGAAFGVNLLTQGVNSARIVSRGFGYSFGRSGFSNRSGFGRSSGRSGSGGRSRGRSNGGSRGRGRSRLSHRGGSRCRSRCRSRCGCRCGRGLSIGSTDHRGKEYNHCKFLHRFSIHKRVCIKFTRKYIKKITSAQVF